jgi:hypothetical protein
MRRVLRKKRVRAGLGLVFALVFAAGAVAYFTTTGSGTGSATVGSSSGLTLHPSLSGGSLYPGTSNTVNFTVDNGSAGHQLLNVIHLNYIKACTGAGSSWNGTSCSNSGTEQTTCESVETGASDTTTANFWMPDVTVNHDYGNGSGQTVTPTGTLTMNDLNSSQNACQGANLYLNFTSN